MCLVTKTKYIKYTDGQEVLKREMDQWEKMNESMTRSDKPLSNWYWLWQLWEHIYSVLYKENNTTTEIEYEVLNRVGLNEHNQDPPGLSYLVQQYIHMTKK